MTLPAGGQSMPAGRHKADIMKNMLVIAALAAALSGCGQSAGTQEENHLKEAYSACINTAEGSPEKLDACQHVLEVLKKERAHRQFAEQESVRVSDYQACILARKTGNDQEVAQRCNLIWQEIRNQNAAP